jgi:hypothetical protein
MQSLRTSAPEMRHIHEEAIADALAVLDGPDDDSADELVRQIHLILTTRNPDADPGDMTIGIQDDMPMVEVHLAGFHRGLFLAVAPTVFDALTLVRDRLLAGEPLPADDEGLVGVLTPLWVQTPPYDVVAEEGDGLGS